MKTASEKSVRKCEGSALIAVYWVIGVISMAVFTTLQFLLFEVSHTNSRSNAFRAEQLAHSAAAIATNPEVNAYDPILTASSDDGSYSAIILSEGSRIPLNTFLTVGQRQILERLFEQWGMDDNTARQLVDEMIDWTDADSRNTGAGKERGWYMGIGKPDYPFNRPFGSLDEVTLLAGYAELAKHKPDWRLSFTVRSSGKLDLNSADADAIAAVCGCTIETAEHFVATRTGSDGERFTEDDEVYESVESALDLLMTFGSDREALLPLLSIDDPVKRIVAVGTVGDTEIEQTWVIQNRSSNPIILDFTTRQLRNE